MELLPDIEGYVHGLVQIEPFVRIQCDGCGFIHDAKPGRKEGNMAIMFCGILFNSKARGDHRRLCRKCGDEAWGEGWDE